MPADQICAERIRAKSVGVSYGTVAALTDITLTVSSGEIVGMVGPNGSGKTSLLRILAGISRPSTGTVLLDGNPLSGIPDRVRARALAYVGQDEHSEMPFTARETLLIGRSPRHRAWESYNDADQHTVDQILADLDLTSLANRTLDRMSGGERQRVLIARALAQEAEILLLDEPTNHLDPYYQQCIMEAVTSRNMTTVVVLHDLNLAAAYCSRVVMLAQGRTIANGPPSDALQVQRVADTYTVRTRAIDLGDRPHLVFGR
ncbi:MAG: ABC transporter ATP-binding protein [Nocardioides sp.]